MPENLYTKLPSAPSISQESFNVRKYYQDITDLKNRYNKKRRKYKNAYNKLLHASTGASVVGVIRNVSTIGTDITKSDENIKMLTTNYYMHLQVQVLLV